MKRISVIATVLALGMALACPAFSKERPFVVIDSSKGEQVTIYFNGWLFESVSGPLAPRSVRSNHRVIVQSEDTDYAKQFLDWLRIDLLHANPLRDEFGNPVFGSALLVIDVVEDGKVQRTYFSDGCFLYGSGGATRRRVDAEFRERFSFDSPESFDEEWRCRP